MAQSPSTDALEVEVKNFGPIAKAKFDLRPLTVFIGPSNSGKTYLSTLLYALHRAWYKDYAGAHQVGRSFWKSPKTNFEELRDWLNERFDVSSEIPPVGSTPLSARKNFELPSQISELIHEYLRTRPEGKERGLEYEMERCFGTESIQPLVRRAGSRRAGAASKASVTLTRNGRNAQGSLKSFAYSIKLGARSSVSKMVASQGMPLHIWAPETDSWAADLCVSARMHGTIMNYGVQNILHDVNLSEGGNILYEDHFNERIDGILQEIGTNLFNAAVTNSLDPIGRSAHYLPADRTGVMLSHQMLVNTALENATRAGMGRLRGIPLLSGVRVDFLERLAAINGPSRSLDKSGVSPDGGSRGVLKQVAKDIESNLLKGEVHSEGPHNSIISYPVFSFKPEGWSDSLPLMRASSMVSELSPVVLYLRRVVAPGDVLIIEEPEAHLHPKLQVEFVKLLAELAKAGVRIILTTHSSLVLDTVANFVFLEENLDSLEAADRQNGNNSEKRLSREDVGIWSFVPKNRPKGTVVEEIEFDPRAGGFPAQLDDAAMNLYNEWASIDNAISEGGE